LQSCSPEPLFIVSRVQILDWDRRRRVYVLTFGSDGSAKLSVKKRPLERIGLVAVAAQGAPDVIEVGNRTRSRDLEGALRY
jgi:ABC-type enterochelin transport system permease subunit